MSRDVESNLKAKDYCGCGCGEYGTLKKPWRDGTRCIQRTCTCNRCRGRRNRKSGQRRQRKAVNRIGVPAGMGGGNEETMRSAVRLEVKSGKQVGPAHTAYLRARAQIEANQDSIGDHRPPLVILAPDGASYELLVIRSDEVAEVVAALAEQMGMMP